MLLHTPQIITIESELESVKRLEFPTFLNEKDIDPTKLVMRWGRGWLSTSSEYTNVINSVDSIILNVNKLKSLKKLAKVVDTPKLFEKRVPKVYSAVIRPMRHSSGKSFQIVKGPYDIPEGYYGTELIETDHEYRVWYAFGRCMMARRVPLEKHITKFKVGRKNISVETNNNPEELCRSEWGYSFEPIYQDLKEQTIKAFETIGLQTGAADILLANCKYYFLELNSAPTIDCRAIKEFFKNRISEYVNSLVPVCS